MNYKKLRFRVAVFLATPFLFVVMFIFSVFRITFNIYIGTCSKEKFQQESENKD